VIRIAACLLLIALPGFHGTHSPVLRYSDWTFYDDENMPDEEHVSHAI
jgi:hypothetical protein